MNLISMTVRGALSATGNYPRMERPTKKTTSGTSKGLQAAAMAACRDAMAFFSINFSREPVVMNWLNSGMPDVQAPDSIDKTDASNTATSSDGRPV